MVLKNNPLTEEVRNLSRFHALTTTTVYFLRVYDLSACTRPNSISLLLAWDHIM
jgi:hypothetical protein